VGANLGAGRRRGGLKSPPTIKEAKALARDRYAILREIAGPSGAADAQRSFWAYCRYINPRFFREDRPHLRKLAQTLQALCERRLVQPGGVCLKLIVNLPPRMGKSYTLALFNQWLLGRNPAERIITVSYNEILASRFARAVRDGISQKKADDRAHAFRDVFPGVRVKKGDAAAGFWALEGQPMSFLATGFGGTITGVGCSVGIIDDPVKNHLEAMNEAALEAQFAWYNDTFFSRLEEGAVQIVVMTRWATGDLSGRLTGREPDAWHVLSMPACLDEEKREMLCPSLLSWARWREIRKTTSEPVLLANYQQQPLDIQGRMYERFSLYDHIPQGPGGEPSFEKTVCYADTADTGRDYLCAVIAGAREGRLWVLDVLYTDKGMEYTEPALAGMLARHRVNEAWIESNNGGRGFARNVRRLMAESGEWAGTAIIPRVQRANKQARILVAAPYVMTSILYPRDWGERWPDYHRAMIRYQRRGVNRNDDAPDATSGLAELMTGGLGGRDHFVSGRGNRT
jgi:predicted phage terminase large subunit-like protein